MIRSLRTNFRGIGLDLLVNQATLGRCGIEDLDDDEVAALHRTLQAGLDCMRNDVSFYDAGLLRDERQ